MTYKSAIDYINSIYFLGSKLGLERIKILTSLFDNPQSKIKIIHVAGTNGKGSTCAMISAILQSVGLRVGMFTSPHLLNYNERFKINDVSISNNDFARHIELIKYNCEKMDKAGLGYPTIFECLTAMAFNYFYENKVDIVLLEVGMGGCLDATNIIENPLLCVITSISFDHCEYLGDSLTEIAQQKGGIIKKNSNVVLYSQSKEVYNVIKNICNFQNANLFYADSLSIEVINQDLYKTVFCVESPYFKLNNIELFMIGDYQIKNAITAILSVYALNTLGFLIPEINIYSGLKNAYWNGRMEIIDYNPLIILDGAHNPDGINMLEKAMKNYFKDKTITLLLAVLKDKNYEYMIEHLMSFSSNIVVTQLDTSRALNADLLFNQLTSYNKKVYIEKNIGQAFLKAKKITSPTDVICCTGSLYLIGEIKKFANK